MVAGFRRSLSPPGGPSTSSSPGRHPTDEKPRHARSTSLPCPSHPALSHLRDQIRSLRSWPQPDANPLLPAERIADGLVVIAAIHPALDELLRLPLARDPLRRGCPAWADRLLDDLLRLADALGCLRSAALTLRQHQSEARAAIRRRDPGRLSSAVRAHRRTGKELARLASAVGGLTRPPQVAADEAEVAAIMREAVAATAAATEAILAGVAALSSAAAAAAAGASASKGWSMAGALRRLSSMKRRGSEEEEEEEAEMAEMAALEKLEAWEECIEGLEKGSERAFRSLVNTRVLLLNILTPSL